MLFLRLCLVAVKRFPENTYFPEKLISGKGKYFSMFGCISKKFPENIFWCLEKKKENTNPEKHKPQPRKNHQRWQAIAIWDRDRWPDHDRNLRSRSTTRSRSRLLREITIDGAISPSVDRNLGSSSLAVDRDGKIAINDTILPPNASPLARELSLSLSHFPEILWRENRSVNWFPWSKAFFLGQQISISGK